MLEPQIRLVPKPMRRLHFLRHNDILNADAEIPVLVIARLVGEHIPRRERDLAVLDPCADANRPLMHIEIRPHAVTRTVSIVEAFCPQELASEGVEREAGRSFGEDGGVEGDDAFQDEGVGEAFQGGWGAEVQGARRVGRAVEVLGAGVAEVDGLGVDGGAVAWFGFVVDDGSVGAGGGDSVEGEAGEVVLGSGVDSRDQKEVFFLLGLQNSILTPVSIRVCQRPGLHPGLFPLLSILLPARRSTRSAPPRLECDKLASLLAPSCS